jgi:Ni,Fe-hydrogenase maturation factor
MTKIADVINSAAAETAHLRHQIKLLDSDARKLREAIGSQKQFAADCSAAIVALEPYPRYKHAPNPKSKKPVAAVLDFSDWHIGEVIQANETEGFNAYNLNIAEKRVFRIVDDFINWVEVHRTAYNIDTCHVFGKGDYVSGDIHQELVVTNEFPLPVQAVKAGTLLGECIHRLAAHFKTLIVDAVGADNHGRLQHKPQAKQKSQNSMSYIVHQMANQATKECTNVTWNIAEGMTLLAEVNNFRFLLEHGDTIKSQMGIPYYGFQRLVGRESARRMNTDKGFHYLSIGHFHVPAIIEGRTIVNGSLSGTSEFDHSCGRHANPCQVAFLVHGKHGVFNFTPFQGQYL